MDALVAEKFQAFVDGAIFNWRPVTAFREVALVSPPLTASSVHIKALEDVAALLHDPGIGNIWKNKEEFIAKKGPQDMAKKMAAQKMSDFQAAVDAATLIFAHSILDDLVLSACEVAMLHAPEDWAHRVAQKPVPLSEVREAAYLDILRKKLVEFHTDIERKSLMVKMDAFYQVCHPKDGDPPYGAYTYDRTRLADLDKRRHAIVHNPKTLSPIPTISDDVDYMQDTSRSLIHLLYVKYGLQISGFAHVTL